MKLAVLAALFVSTCQVGPFNDPPTPVPTSDPGWPDPPIAAAGAPASGCAAAIENTKRLGCGFEADDSGAWCATRSSKEVSCMASAKTCLAQRKCTEASK